MRAACLVLWSVTCLARHPAWALEEKAKTKEKEHADSSPALAEQIALDVKSLFTTRENLSILVIGLGATLGASRLDGRLASSGFNSELNGGGKLDGIFESGEILGGALVQSGGAFLTYGLGRILDDEGVEKLGRDLVRAQLVTQGLTFGLKVAASRERPDRSNHRSFPSGHASGAFASATVLQRRYGWKVGAPAFAVAGYIAGSRLNESRHYLSDVVFGATVGILVGRTVTVDIARARFAVSPTVTEGGVGIQLTWMGNAPPRSCGDSVQ